ncbi:MAG TPA: PEP-CTERM sorting domain-containing protein [Burkholderiaceae bacterium]
MTSLVFAGTTPLFTVQVLSAVPEASTWMLLLGGLGAMAFVYRRRYH